MKEGRGAHLRHTQMRASHASMRGVESTSTTAYKVKHLWALTLISVWTVLARASYCFMQPGTYCSPAGRDPVLSVGRC